MGQYLTPGVYIEEVPGAKPIAGVGTATGAFVGIAEKGPIGEARLITNWTQFVETFGGFVPYGYLAYAVNQFFSEGGTRCYVVRTCHYDYTVSPVDHVAGIGTLTLDDSAASPAGTLRIDALSPGSWSDHLWVEVADVKKDSTGKFRLVVWYNGVAVEAFEELTRDNILGLINNVSKYIVVSQLGTSTLPPARSCLDIFDRGTPAEPTLRVTGRGKGLTLAVADGATDKFSLIIIRDGLAVDQFTNVSMTDVLRKVNSRSEFIEVADLKSTNNTTTHNNRPFVNVWEGNDATPVAVLRVAAIVANISLTITDGTTPATQFTLAVTNTVAATTETYTDLTMADVESRINGISEFIFVQNLKNNTDPATNRPVNTGPVSLAAPYVLPFFGFINGDDGLADGLKLPDAAAVDSLMVSAFREGVAVKIEDTPSGASNFKLTVVVNNVESEIYDDLNMDTVENIINGNSQYIEVITLTDNRPAGSGATPVVVTPLGLEDADFIGDAATQNGIYAFDLVDDINIMAIPDRSGDREVILAALTYCQNRRDCFFVADPPFGLDPQGVLAFKEGDASYGAGEFAGNGFNSSFGALYYPWVLISDPVTGGKKFVPPSGAVVGTYSSTDVLRGVHKAPAGTIDGYLNSTVGIERIVTRGEQELLNPEHINVIRTFPTSGIVIWGARTLSADPEWRYINVRRLLLFIEESIYNGTQWVVFEPNDRTLWAKVHRDVTAFLSVVWRSGALFGSTEEEAFYVKIDDENNPQETRDLGQLIIDIGVAPVKPAEFVIFRISQKTQASG